MLERAQLQRPRESVDGGRRRRNGPALFETDVPVDPDSGELGHLLPPQAGRSSAPAITP